jgi:hypothetical protein
MDRSYEARVSDSTLPGTSDDLLEDIDPFSEAMKSYDKFALNADLYAYARDNCLTNTQFIRLRIYAMSGVHSLGNPL